MVLTTQVLVAGGGGRGGGVTFRSRGYLGSHSQALLLPAGVRSTEAKNRERAEPTAQEQRKPTVGRSPAQEWKLTYELYHCEAWGPAQGPSFSGVWDKLRSQL